MNTVVARAIHADVEPRITCFVIANEVKQSRDHGHASQ